MSSASVSKALALGGASVRSVGSVFVALGVLGSSGVVAQQGKALLDAPLVVADSQHRIMLTLDYNQDGLEDAVSYWWEDDYYDKLFFRIWLNDGQGELVMTHTSSIAGDIAGPSNEVKFLPADLNGDELPDFFAIFSQQDSAYLYAYAAQPNQGPWKQSLMSWNSFNSSIQGAVAIPLPDEPEKSMRAMLIGNSLWVHCITETATSGSAVVCDSYDFPTKPDHIELADWDGDGKEDLFVHEGGAGYLFLLDHNDGSLHLIGKHEHGLVNAPKVVMGDIDGDGDRDAVAFEETQYAVLRRTNINRFIPEAPQQGGPATHLFDVDGDGDLDGACCGGSGGSPDQVFNDELSIFRIALNDGTGAFAPAFEIPGLGATRLAGAADLDGNGHLDLIAGRSVYYAPGPIVSAPMAKQSLGSQSAKRVDVDGDGDPDLAPSLDQDARNMGNGMLQAIAPWLADAPVGMQFVGPGVHGDFDGDGDSDVIAPMVEIATNTVAGMRFLANNGGGGFVDQGDAGAVPPGYELSDFVQVEYAITGDADGDGDLDVIWPEAFNTSLCSHVFWNQGAGVFQPGPVFWIERAQHIGDFTGDAIPDLLVADFSFANGKLWMRHGLGAGAFGDRLQIAGFDFKEDELVVTDFNGDGDLDIVRTTQGSTFSYLTAMTNTGAGIFSSNQVGQPLYGKPDSHLALADMTGDGFPDLLFGPLRRAPSALVIIPRSADGQQWLTGVNQVVRQVAFEIDGSSVLVPGLSAFDSDGDGDLDVNSGLLVRGGAFAGDTAGARLQLADGVADANGMTPTLGATGPFRVGEVVELRLTGAPGQTAGVLEISQANSPAAPGPNQLSGVTALQRVAVPSIVGFTTNGGRQTGNGSWSKSFTVTPNMAGQTFSFRARLIDPATGLETVESNTLRLTYGL